MTSRAVCLSFVLLTLGCASPCEDGARDELFEPRDFACAEGAAAPCVLTEPVRDDDQRTVCVAGAAEPATRWYVVDQIRMPELTSSDEVVGLELDAIDSGDGSTERDADCQQLQPDFVHPVRSTRGIDNALAGLVPTLESLQAAGGCPGGSSEGCFDRIFDEAIRSGELLLLIRVSDLDDLVYDPEVSVEISLGRTADGAPPMGDPVQPLAPGQRFVIERPLGASLRADVFEGRLRALLGEMELPLHPLAAPARMNRAELRADVTEQALVNANLGGAGELDEVIPDVDVYLDEIGAPAMASTIRMILESVSDLDPSADEPQICDALSVGYAISAVAAEVVE